MKETTRATSTASGTEPPRRISFTSSTYTSAAAAAAAAASPPRPGACTAVNHPLRRGSTLGGSSLNIQLDAVRSMPIVEQLAEALAANHGRVIEVFREWDGNSSGRVTKSEFRQGLSLLGLSGVSGQQADDLFDEIDVNHNGEIDYRELHSKLRRTGSLPAALECDNAMRSPTSIDVLFKGLDTSGTPRSNAVGHMKERVVKARSVGIAAVEQHARTLAQPDFELYMTDEIDEATLKQRKFEARMKAMAEYAPLATLDIAFVAFAEAVAARENARSLYEKAEETEDAAKAKLVAALQQVESESLEKAGPSGAVHTESYP